jgi:hypothetical protein
MSSNTTNYSTVNSDHNWGRPTYSIIDINKHLHNHNLIKGGSIFHLISAHPSLILDLLTQHKIR